VEIDKNEEDANQSWQNTGEKQNCGFSNDSKQEESVELPAEERNSGEATLYTREAFDVVKSLFGDSGEGASRCDDATMCTRDAMRDVHSFFAQETAEQGRSDDDEATKSETPCADGSKGSRQDSPRTRQECQDEQVEADQSASALEVFVDTDDDHFPNENIPPTNEDAEVCTLARRTLDDPGSQQSVLQAIETNSDEDVRLADDEEAEGPVEGSELKQ